MFTNNFATPLQTSWNLETISASDNNTGLAPVTLHRDQVALHHTMASFRAELKIPLQGRCHGPMHALEGRGDMDDVRLWWMSL